MNIVIIQPPLVQLNTPYPSGAYLQAFFKNLPQENKQTTVTWVDLSIELFHELFSKSGLALLFEQTEKKALIKAQKAEDRDDDETAFQLRRYISQQKLWIDWIDTIKAIVCDKPTKKSMRELSHEFVRSPHVPRGMRMENFLSSLERDVNTDDVRLLASFAIADIADYITAVFDKEFALVRYAESLTVNTKNYEELIEGLNSPVLKIFYERILKRTLKPLLEKATEKTFFCISVPFPGVFGAALYTGRFIKEKAGKNAIVAFGGGYINTELRNIDEKRLFLFFDYLCFDRGYGSLFSIFEKTEDVPLYKTAYLSSKGDIIAPLGMNQETKLPLQVKKYKDAEEAYTRSITPDYTGIDFSRYPRMVDDINAMHRLWNDGAWLKAYLAHGCYWHRCAFCDTDLDYVCAYRPVPVQQLHRALLLQAQLTGIHGIHFVDEALPPKKLCSFALENCREDLQTKRLSFWGNIRFEKTFSRDIADLLSYSGLTGVSGGIEMATGEGLATINKGTELKHIVKACCAFKEAGILVHGYMIYGFWFETPQILIDSMETLRQFFKEGLLDSAYWHKFVLTRHSTVYQEWKKGLHPELIPQEGEKTPFAQNDLHFKGEKDSSQYGSYLNVALESWMHKKDLSKPVHKWFPFKMPKPSIKPNFIEALIDDYEKDKTKEFTKKALKEESFVWLGSKPITIPGFEKGSSQICWMYMGEMMYANVPKGNSTFAQWLWNLRPATKKTTEQKEQDSIALKALPQNTFKALRGCGLCRLAW